LQNYVRLKKDEIGGLFKTGYWSSTEVDYDYAWNFYFFGGDAGYGNKHDAYGVRAVRAF
jgi:hypothetical protein